MILTFTYFLLSILLLGVSIFATQNQQIITLKFLNLESINLPLGLVLIFSAGLGTIVTTILQLNNRQANRQVANSIKNNSENSNSYQPSYQSNYKGNTQTRKPQTSKPPVKDKIADFDDDFDDDWD
ncbi:Protein of unknown function (DUF1049) [Synechococcus sp. PCC 7502]|uniref:lipopolysaccharide assembly protein LapA domain-containing protein n=1 Tax=Synechococcus sp. PCC 7502 TaxID=1173263 RepID=UPI00029FE40B|nr:lipopolysaccharide assembly protein LapA domain-containing protein [Synechococcus sp. PCC 7502]AFY74858.1 Protein of unknown function (DUF1049) [Synechococcus sp. PCC 7502]